MLVLRWNILIRASSARKTCTEEVGEDEIRGSRTLVASKVIEARIELMHNENQKWIRTVAAGVIAILLTLVGALAKVHFNF